MTDNLIVRRRADLAVTPWKNGGGRTREILVVDGADGTPALRVSMAEVAADGPFSHYPGVARVLTVLTGDPLALTVDGRPERLGVGDVLTFSGEARTDCRLTGGPVEDLGVMTWPEAGRPARAATLALMPAEGARVTADDVLAVVAVEPVGVDGVQLRRGDSVQVTSGATTLTGAGTVALVRR